MEKEYTLGELIEKAEDFDLCAPEYNCVLTPLLAHVRRLQEIEAAAKNLVAQRGRHNTEVAYKRLEETLK